MFEGLSSSRSCTFDRVIMFLSSNTSMKFVSFRYKYENDKVIDAASPDSSSPLPYQVYGNSKIGADTTTKGTYDQLLERQVLPVVQA